MSEQRNWTLAQVIDRVLRPHGRYAVKTLREYARACRRFERFMDGAPRACDVTQDALKGFFTWQITQGYPAKDAGKQAQTVATVVRHADASLLRRWEPRQRAIDGDANGIGEVATWPLVRVVNDLIRPTGTRSARTIVAYRRDCRRYCRFRGGPQRVCDVTPELIEQFEVWQRKTPQGYSEGTAIDACDHVAAVVRCADKSRLPLKYRRKPFADARRQAFDDKGVDGTLESIMVNQYFPSNTRINDRKTECQYAYAVGRLSRFLGRPAVLADLSDLTFGRWMRSMRDEGDEGLEPKTINGYMNKLRAFWTWAAKRRIVDLFPTIQNVSEPRRIPKAWSREQMQSLYDGCGKMPGNVAGVPAALWWRAFVLVMFDTGERTTALLGLAWSYFDVHTGDLEAPAEIRKSRKKPMLYRLKPATVAALEAIRLPQRQRLFAWPWSMAAFYLHYRRLLRLAGLPYELRRSGPQKVRRTFASFVEAAGGNATDALDHTARKTTVESYLDPRIIKRPAVNLLLPNLDEAV